MKGVDSYEDMSKLDPTTFQTLYAGIDPMEKSRLLIKKVVRIPVEYGKYGGTKHFYCLEESTLTRSYLSKYPHVQVQLRKLSNFDLEETP